jgi:hypothetical protein
VRLPASFLFFYISLHYFSYRVRYIPHSDVCEVDEVDSHLLVAVLHFPLSFKRFFFFFSLL